MDIISLLNLNTHNQSFLICHIFIFSFLKLVPADGRHLKYTMMEQTSTIVVISGAP